MAKKRSLAELPKAKHPGVSVIERMDAKQLARFHEIVDEYLQLQRQGKAPTAEATARFISEECGIVVSDVTLRRELKRRG